MVSLRDIVDRSRPRAIEYLVVASTFILAMAYLSQYGPSIGISSLFGVKLGLEPCALCLYQRYPYMAIILIGGLAALVLRSRDARATSYRRFVLALLILLLLSNAAVAGYHIGVEQAWWTGPNSCSGRTSGLGSVNLIETLGTKPVVRCDQPTTLWFGISIATYNFLLALGLAGYGLSSLIGKRRNEVGS